MWSKVVWVWPGGQEEQVLGSPSLFSGCGPVWLVFPLSLDFFNPHGSVITAFSFPAVATDGRGTRFLTSYHNAAKNTVGLRQTMAATPNWSGIITTDKDHLVNRSQNWNFNAFWHFLSLWFFSDRKQNQHPSLSPCKYGWGQGWAG